MLPGSEEAATTGNEGFEDPVTHQKAMIQGRDTGLLQRHQGTI
jgi:hypothetical protein